MDQADYSVLDTPEISMNSFYPRRNWTETPEGAEDYTINVAEGVSVSCRFFPVDPKSPVILFFYGNGETAADYDNIAPVYNQIGLNFFVADYRGYGRSDGLPAFTTMLADARTVLETARVVLGVASYSGPMFVMGRSMGRHAAFELAASPESGLQGVIIESGRPNLGNFAASLDHAQGQALEQAYQEKVSSISIPALAIHGENDTLAPVQHAVAMYDSFASEDKRLLTVPGAGHNDLLSQGLNQYFGAIRDFVFQGSEAPPGATIIQE